MLSPKAVRHISGFTGAHRTVRPTRQTGGTQTVSASLNEGAFSSMATGLQDGTTYYYRCYASNEIGTAWASATTNFVAEDIAGPGQIWDGGGEDDDWSTSENWVGDVMPGRPATSVITFNNGGAESAAGCYQQHTRHGLDS